MNRYLQLNKYLSLLNYGKYRYSQNYQCAKSYITNRMTSSCRNASTSVSNDHLLVRVQNFFSNPAVGTPSRKPSTYGSLMQNTIHFTNQLINSEFPSKRDRVGFMCQRDESYVIAQWSIWASGSVAVPLFPEHPAEEIKYVLKDSEASTVIIHPYYKALIDPIAKELGIHVIMINSCTTTTSSNDRHIIHEFDNMIRSNIYEDDIAQILYTSGTTGRPKGVVTLHSNITSQVKDIVTAWEITQNDKLLHFLPLHHTHGIVCKLLSSLWAGGYCEFLPNAKAKNLWSHLAKSNQEEKAVTMFMAVPTIYMNLLEEVDNLDEYTRSEALKAIKRMRVNISGSMACPKSIIQRWELLTGHRLVERYGMTELGMVLTNPIDGDRNAGYVGLPFPSVQTRVVDTNTGKNVPNGVEGELRVKGPSVFKEYWKRPLDTEKEFDEDKWFKTGDIVVYNADKNSYRILGRASVDIIKTGGYKVSALDVEKVILEYPSVLECYVIGLDDEKWGEIISAVVRLSNEDTHEIIPDILRFAKEHLADYKIPRKIKIVKEIQKNAMGKVNKKELKKKWHDI